MELSNKTKEKKPIKPGVSRISVSLPENLLLELDQMINERGYESRSQAITEMINSELAGHKTSYDETIMAGTINIVYDNSVMGVKQRISTLQHEYLDEVISSLQVNLVDRQTLEVMLVQGPALTLRMVADKVRACKGVLSGKLIMSTAILPPVHPLPSVVDSGVVRMPRPGQ